MLSVDAILSVDVGAKVKTGDILARISTESAKTRDITGGLPRVAELFEARKPKDAAIIAEIAGTIRFGRDYKNKRRISIEPMDKTEETPSTLFRRASTSICRTATSSKRAISSSRAIPPRTTSWRSRGSRRSPAIWSMRSRKSTGCRA